MEKKVFKIEGMHCASCASKIISFVEKLEGVKSAEINFILKKLYVEGDNISKKKIGEAVLRAGNYKIAPEKGADEEVKEVKNKMLLAALFSSLIMILMAVDMLFVPVPYYFLITYLLGFPVIFIAGYKTHKSSLRGITTLSLNMDTLVTMGSLIPYFLSLLRFWFPQMTTFVEMAVSILTLHLVGRFLEAKAKGKTSESIKKLLNLGVKMAKIIEDGKEKEIMVEELKIGDIMIIRPGEKMPTDGIIIEGESHIDESMVTGESMPVSKKQGDATIGSTINKEGVLKVRVVKVGEDTFLSQVIKLIEECQGSKVPIQEFADKITGYFVPFVVLIALGAFISWMAFPLFHISIAEYFNFPWTDTSLPILTLAILASTAVLVISCPCALGLATPTALMVGSGLGAEKGILIRQGKAIQAMKDIKAIVFDKTGTLTKGRPSVTDIIALEGSDNKDQSRVLKLAASLEKNSEHPLALAITEKAASEKIQLKEAKNIKAVFGKGVVGEIEGKIFLIGNKKLMEENNVDLKGFTKAQERVQSEAKTAIFLAEEKKALALIAITDSLKEDAVWAINVIEGMGIKTAIITGDNEKTAKTIARKTGIGCVVSEVLPEDKVKEVKKMQEKYGLVAMVGDGINDAPALEQANVGIAIGSGADIAIESADITLMRGDLAGVVFAIKLSRKIFKKIKENYFWAWFYNAIAIPMAFFGLLHPIVGAAAMAVSSLSVIFNSLRLKKIKI